MEEFKVGDRVEVLGSDGIWYTGKIININQFREPAFEYAVDLDCDSNDYGFVSREQIRKGEK